MYSNYASVTLDKLPWPEKPDDHYDKECNLKERIVTVASEATRQLLVKKMSCPKGRRGRGRALCHDVPELGLLKGDRLAPHHDLKDLTGYLKNPVYLEEARLPFKCVFWRASFVGESLSDGVVFRNPIFNFAGDKPNTHAHNRYVTRALLRSI